MYKDFFTTCGGTQFEVYARQKTPITLKKIKARIIKSYKIINDSTFIPVTKDLEITAVGKNEFQLSSINTLGTIEFEIELESGIEKIRHKVMPISVKLYIKNYSLSNDHSLDLEILKDVEGINAPLDYEGLDASGKVLKFKIIGIINGKAEAEILNKGARFNKATKDMISRLSSNDMIIIKDLYYKVCFLEQKYKSDFIIKIK